MDNIANPFNFSGDMVDRKYDLVSFNFEKLLLAEAIVIGTVKSTL